MEQKERKEIRRRKILFLIGTCCDGNRKEMNLLTNQRTHFGTAQEEKRKIRSRRDEEIIILRASAGDRQDG